VREVLEELRFERLDLNDGIHVVSRDVHRLRRSGAVEGYWGHVGVILEGYGVGAY
jgi:hypothetical protein